MKQTILSLFLLLAAIIGGSGWWFWHDMQIRLHSPLPLATDTDFIIRPGMSLMEVCSELQRTELMPQAYYLLIEARLRQKEGQIKAGEYLIKKGTTPLQLLDQFVAGRVKQYALTLIEGWTLAQALHALKNNDHLVQTLDGADRSRVLQALAIADAQDPEGLLFPDTYHFPGNTPDIDVLRRAHLRMQKILDEEWRQRAEGLPYGSPYEALIMASIVEKEASLPEERPLIAGVFVRRLQKGIPLQADPTIIYALGERFDGNIRKEDMVIDSPYNTYLNSGLPPTPIAMPGRDSLYAALHPDNGNALYFVAKGDGAHHFSETFTEHQKAVSRYQSGNAIND